VITLNTFNIVGQLSSFV